MPIFLSFNVPMLLLNIIYQKIKSIFVKTQRKTRTFPKFEQKKAQNRNFDIVVYGATGFTGKLVSQYISSNYDKKLNWAIAGRSQSKLEEVNKFINNKIPILIADSDNITDLQNIIGNTKIIINTAGPFDKYGTNVVGLCAANGTHYVDITGEVAWVRQMIEQYDELAAKTGAKIINCCGLDSIPFDLITLQLNNQLMKQSGQKLSKIQLYDEINGGFSGGTFGTLMHSLKNPPPKSKLGYDPLIKKIGENEKISKVFKTNLQRLLKYDFKIKKWIGMWTLADGNAAIIKRSQALSEEYATKLLYCEALQYPNLIAGLNFYLGLMIQASFLGNSWFSNFYYNNFILQPGQGPSDEQLKQGWAKISAYGWGENGSKAKACFSFFQDPGYVDTARMVTEAAMSIHFNNDRLKQQGGFLTPSFGLGEVLIERLVNSGSTMIVEQLQ